MFNVLLKFVALYQVKSHPVVRAMNSSLDWLQIWSRKVFVFVSILTDSAEWFGSMCPSGVPLDDGTNQC